MSSPRPLRLAAGPALAADFDRPYAPPHAGYGAPPSPGYDEDDGPERRPHPPRPEPEFRRPRFTAAPGPCREFVRRRLDPDGEPVLRRVRVCDEPAFERGPPPPEEIPPRRWGGPRW